MSYATGLYHRGLVGHERLICAAIIRSGGPEELLQPTSVLYTHSTYETNDSDVSGRYNDVQLSPIHQFKMV